MENDRIQRNLKKQETGRDITIMESWGRNLSIRRKTGAAFP